MTLALPLGALTADLGQLIGACLVRLRAAYATPAGAGIVTAGYVLALGVFGRAVWAVARVVRRRRAEWRRHRLLVRFAGERLPDLPAVVVDAPHAAAYSVAGRRKAVVVTRGIVDLLSGAELSAVLAHENAHLAARHHRLLTAAAVVAQALPIVPLLREAPARVGRLLEMDADEHAVAHHEPRVIASALVAVATGKRQTGTPQTGTPQTAVPGPNANAGLRPGGVPREGPHSQAGADAIARVNRLLDPPARLPAARRGLARVGIVALTVAPLLLAAAPMAVALV